MRNEVYIVTGANGHLGKSIVKELVRENKTVHGLILQGESFEKIEGVNYFFGDVCDKQSLSPLFDTDKDVYVIHTAAIVDISKDVSPHVKEVNVEGTRNVVELCKQYNVKKLLHVSSVHAIPEKSNFEIIEEVEHFSGEEVVGGYAKTKAQASQLVMDEVKGGLDATIVHPSGIMGPDDDEGNNHIVQMLSDYVHGKLPACVNGGYDFVDVRDVAKGCISALEKGKKGECYILSNRHYKVDQLLNMVQKTKKSNRIITFPMWMLDIIAPVFELSAKL